jgi:hypothetical protein
MQTIPFYDSSQWKEQLTLTNELFIFWFKWNALNEFWTMDIYNASEDPVVLGIKIVPSYPLIGNYAVLGLPKGEIICQNIVGTPQEIGRFDMSQKFDLVYYEPGELEQIKSILLAQQAEQAEQEAV